ncbi:MAG: Lipopolysaccharide export system permease protein lptG, partial [Pseudomonadota bacterium]
MTLIGRYLARSILGSVAFVLFGFLAIFSLFDLINELEDVGRAGYRLQHALAVVGLGVPTHVYELMPIAALIGTIHALAQLASHSEFTAMRAAGLGRRRAMATIARVGVWLALATLVVGEGLTPVADKLSQHVRLAALGGTVAGQFKSGLWIRDTQKDAQGEVQRMRFVNVGELLTDSTMKSLRVFEFDRDFRLVEILEAQAGRFQPATGWRLEEAQRTVIEPVPGAGSTSTLRATHSRAGSLAWSSELNPDILGVLMLVPERMSAWSLVQYVQHLKDNRQRADRYEIALWKKIVYPFA